MSLVHLQNVTKLYGTVIGVNDITLKLEPGVYGLLGPNGSGKTTLINLMLGQLQPTIGKVELFGLNPWRRSELLRQIGLCPAIEVSYPRVSGLDWVTYLVRLHGFGPDEARQRAVDALTQVRLDKAMERPMRNYSLGMRQRTKLAQAIAHDPEFLILDEPFNGLDPVGRFEMINFLRGWTERGRSLILASHILHEVEAIRPDFLLISGGRLLASGSQQEVHQLLTDSPSKLFFSSSQPKRLANLLLDCCPIDSIEFHNDGAGLTVETRSAAALFEAIPALVRETGIEVHEMSSFDDSLKALFSRLMEIHRGQNRQGGPV